MLGNTGPHPIALAKETLSVKPCPFRVPWALLLPVVLCVLLVQVALWTSLILVASTCLTWSFLVFLGICTLYHTGYFSPDWGMLDIPNIYPMNMQLRLLLLAADKQLPQSRSWL